MSAERSRGALLVVAGRDSSGAAGLDADRAAARAAGVACDCISTADTQQDESGLRELGAIDPEVWSREAWSRIASEAEAPVAAIKFGLLPGVAALAAARRLVERARVLRPGLAVVLDPVIAPTRGGRFLDAAGVAALAAWAGSMPLVLTPNLPEAEELVAAGEGAAGSDAAMVDACGADAVGARSESELDALALSLPRAVQRQEGLEPEEGAPAGASDERAQGPASEPASADLDAPPAAVLLKDGHRDAARVVDRLVHPSGELLHFDRPRLAGAAIRGSGCRLASFLAARLAHGDALEEACAAAIAHVEQLLREAVAADPKN